MSDTKDDGGPFHPMVLPNGEAWVNGASFRAVAAMHAMAAILSADPDASVVADEHAMAKMAVACADALIAELKK